jgi:hypothetical protein
MVLAAAQRDALVIDAADLAMANKMVSDLEEDMPKVFAKIGRTEESIAAEKFIKFVQAKGVVPYEEAYQHVLLNFPNNRDFEGVLMGAIKSGLISLEQVGGKAVLKGVRA